MSGRHRGPTRPASRRVVATAAALALAATSLGLLAVLLIIRVASDRDQRTVVVAQAAPTPATPSQPAASTTATASPPAASPSRRGRVAGTALPTLTAQPLTAPHIVVLPEARHTGDGTGDLVTAPTSTTGSGGTAAAEAEAVRLTNRARAAVGCPGLQVDSRLVLAARAHSRDMAVRDYFGHTRPNGPDPFQRMAAAGYLHGAAENIAAGQATADRVVRDWLASYEHRVNLLDCDLDEVGIGLYVAAGSVNVYYWTQDFGDPR